MTPNNLHTRIADVLAEQRAGSVIELAEWWRTYLPSASLFAKRLSGQDTLASGRRWRWYGTNIPKSVLAECLPALDHGDRNAGFNLVIDSHDQPVNRCRTRVIWYNSRSKSEARLADLGDRSALLDPENTGALALFAFSADADGEPTCHVWICRNLVEEEFVEDLLGPVEPDFPLYADSGRRSAGDKRNTTSFLLRASLTKLGSLESVIADPRDR